MVTDIGLEAGIAALLTAVKPLIALDEPAVIAYVVGVPVAAVYGKVKPDAPAVTFAIVPGVIAGNAFTVAVTATFCVVAPVEVTVMLPPGELFADEAIRAYTVAFITPPDCVSVTAVPEPAYELPPLMLNSKPDGGVTVISFVKLLAATVKLWLADAVPAQVERLARVPVVIVNGFMIKL